MNVNAQKRENPPITTKNSPRLGVLFAVTAAYKNPGHDYKVIKT